MRHVVALSGGKDSTALALRLAEVEPRDYTYFCTPTGDELPELLAHWKRLEVMLGKKIQYVRAGTLNGLIEKHQALPNNRQRWCTRLLKIQPCVAFMRALAREDGKKPLLYVGLRADEETREGIYGDEVQSRYPLREWGWKLRDVLAYNARCGVAVPERTDCARCYDQRISEWKDLLEHHPAIYREAEMQELRTGATFRSPSRDTWPASLVQLRVEFQRGRKVPRNDRRRQLGLLDVSEERACRVCSL